MTNDQAKLRDMMKKADDFYNQYLKQSEVRRLAEEAGLEVKEPEGDTAWSKYRKATAAAFHFASANCLLMYKGIEPDDEGKDVAVYETILADPKKFHFFIEQAFIALV